MKCPHCRSAHTDVYNTRTTKFATQIWRRRHCRDCNATFTTYEAPDLSFLMVTTNKTRKASPYSRAKLFASIYEALATTTDPEASTAAITDTIEAKLLDLQKPALTTTDITKITLTTLKHYQPSAFLHYLSRHSTILSKGQLAAELERY